MRHLRIRHTSTPPALGCRWCGEIERGHGRQWVPGQGWHRYAEPTRQQIHARMRVRLVRALLLS